MDPVKRFMDNASRERFMFMSSRGKFPKNWFFVSRRSLSCANPNTESGNGSLNKLASKFNVCKAFMDEKSGRGDWKRFKRTFNDSKLGCGLNEGSTPEN